MSPSSYTPESKLQRYLQRIQKLVGNRPRSPIPINRSRLARSKSPVMIKTSNIDHYLKYQKSFKRMFQFVDRWNEKSIKESFNYLKNFEDKKGKINANLNVKIYKTNIVDDENKHNAVKIITCLFKSQINKQIVFSFAKISSILKFPDSNKPIGLFNVNKQKNYSEIYMQTKSKNKYEPQSRSVSPLREFLLKTPITQKCVTYQNQESSKIGIRLFVRMIKQAENRLKHNVFEKIKLFNVVNIISEKLSHQYEKKLFLETKYLQNQLERVTILLDNIKKVNNQQKQIISVLNSRLQSRQKDENQSHKIIRKNNSIHNIVILLQKKLFVNQKQGFWQIKQNYSYQNSTNRQIQLRKQISKRRILNFKKILSYKMNLMLKDGFEKIKFQVIFSGKKDLYQSQLRTTQHKSQNLSVDFGNFAKKINRAFELKHSLNKIYTECFEKIDQHALLSLSLSNPFQNVIKNRLKESFRIIYAYSILRLNNYVEKQHSESTTMYSKKSQRSIKKLSECLKKITQKIILCKIDAYSQIKLFNQKNRNFKFPQNSILSQKTIKRQISEFLSQRDKIHQKALSSWNRTKQILNESDSYQTKAR